MDKERTPAEISDTGIKTPDMIAIKGRLETDTTLKNPPVFAELQKFLAVQDNVTYNILPPLDKMMNRILKRAGDLIFSTLVIIGLLSWMIPLIGLLIKLDSKGPVFFLQKRNKRNGGIFTCIKFRSMVENDEADLTPAADDDNRITALGRFLRNHYLDELPQFFNVWLGDMSVIGPRPHMISDNLKYEELIEHYDYRHRVKPGITGLSQVLGYVGDTSNVQRMRDRVQIDIYYVRHWSPALDLKIFFRTFFRIMARKS